MIAPLGILSFDNFSSLGLLKLCISSHFSVGTAYQAICLLIGTTETLFH
ncbi:MAG: hypothetical protein LBC61_07435 [Candidatus Peribacteria bacterium]|jgi:hypothetical protein|nr:hypothetical protein [Candidatus Peribacteria bacterium]